MIKYVIIWFALLAAAFVNGALREATYAAAMPSAWAHRLSVFTGIVLTGFVAWPLLLKWRPSTLRQSVMAGLLWLVMTEAFEFSMTVLYSGRSADFFFGMHDLSRGELWPLFLLWISMLPCIFFMTTKRRRVPESGSARSRSRSRNS